MSFTVFNSRYRTLFDPPGRRWISEATVQAPWFNLELVADCFTDGVGTINKPVRHELGLAGRMKQLRLHTLIVGSARQHLTESHEILGVSHEVRFAATWDMQDIAKDGLLLDVFSKQRHSTKGC